jgi:DNA polymerase-1
MASGDASGVMYLVDAHSLIFQVFHAIPPMTSPTGLPTNAVFGFVRDLLYLRKRKPDYLVCAFDLPQPTFRSELYKEYKAHRDPTPTDLVAQLPLIQRAVEALGIPVVTHPRYEADDVLATIARAASKRGLDVFVCTSDKDCRQLIDDHIRLYNLRKHQEFGRAELLADWGVRPDQVVDLQSLVGDAVDNVPGVPGIGVKTAAKLLQKFDTLDNLLANIDRVAGAKRQENLRASGSILEMSRQLVRLADDVPAPLEWDAWRLQELDAPKMLDLCQEMGFRSFAAEVRETAKSTAVVQHGLFDDEPFPFGANAPAAEKVADSLRESVGNADEKVADSLRESVSNAARGASGPPSETAPTADVPWFQEYHLVDTAEKFEEFFRQLTKQKRFAFDLETTSLRPLEAEIVGIAFSWRPGEGWYLALRGPEGSTLLDPAPALERLRPIFADPKIAKLNQNIKYDLLVLRGRGVEVNGVSGDPMVADYLLHAGERSHNLEELARRYLNHAMVPIEELIGKKSKKQPQLVMDQVAVARVAAYSAEDADAAWRLCLHLESRLDGPPLHTLYDELEIPLIEVLAELEYNGIRLDKKLLKRVGDDMGRRLEQIEKEIYALAGHPFNIGSLPQLRKVLFEELKLPVQGKTGVTGAPSTDQEALEKLAALGLPGSELPRKILEQRQTAKLKSTYVDALPEMVNPATGRIHASFNQTVAATGRLSSSDPNLQNIPVRSEQGREIRQAFLPEEGWRLLTADYSQIELRLLAHFTDDEALQRAFAEDRDVHSLVAAQIFGVEEGLVTPEMRRMAKTVNFGVIYGMSGHGLAIRLGISRDEANRFIEAYFARYPKVLDYQAKLLKECQRTGYVSTILGRRRAITGVRSNSTYQQRNQPEREAINMEIQGSAADLIKLAMLHIHQRLKRDGLRSRMLMQIHDELVFEAPPGELKQLVALVKEEMTTPLEKELGLRTPLKVELAAGPNWLDVEEVTAEEEKRRRGEEGKRGNEEGPQ